MVLHPTENVVIDVAEELNFGLDAPVVLYVFQGWVVVEEATVPSAHFVVANFVGVLDVVFGEDLSGFEVEVVVDPGRGFPVVFRDDVVGDIGFGECGGSSFEFIGEGDVVEEGPRVVELVVPSGFKHLHGGYELMEFFIPHK